MVNLEAVSTDYFHVMGIALKRGRVLEATDVEGRPGVVVVSESLARQMWPGQDALGKRLKVPQWKSPYNFPDEAWRPDGSPLGVASRQLADGRTMIFANLDGIVFYTQFSSDRKKRLQNAASRPIGQRFDPVELRGVLTDEQLYGLLGRGAAAIAVAFGVAALIGAEIVEEGSLGIAVGFDARR